MILGIVVNLNRRVSPPLKTMTNIRTCDKVDQSKKFFFVSIIKTTKGTKIF